MICAACGQENPEGFKFCGKCGAPLAAAAPPREVRKIVTVVFCDLTGSTALGDRTDPEALRATMRGYYEEMRTILERHGGTVEKFIGDAVMAVFGVPVSHEDDALRAVRAAWEMRAAVPTLGLQARIGVNTGEVVAGEGDTLVTGDAVNVAARLEQAAEPGRGADRRARRSGSSATRSRRAGRGDGQRASRSPSRRSGCSRSISRPSGDRAPARHAARRPRARARAAATGLRAVRAASSAASSSPCSVPAGVGKSRLVAEFLATVDADVVAGRCLDYGEGITFWPVVAVLKQLGRAPTRHSTRSSGARPSPNELFWRRSDATRRRRGRASARRRLRRHPLGRADVPRPARPHRRPLARRADLAAVRRAPGAARPTARLGRRQAERDDGPARAARPPTNATS